MLSCGCLMKELKKGLKPHTTKKLEKWFIQIAQSNKGKIMPKWFRRSIYIPFRYELLAILATRIVCHILYHVNILKKQINRRVSTFR